MSCKFSRVNEKIKFGFPPASHKAKAARRFLLLRCHIHLSKHVVWLLLHLRLLLLHEVCLTCHWYAHSHGWLLLSLWLLVEHHSLRLELWHLLLLRGLLHHWEASGATSLTLSLSHTTAHHRRPLLLLHAESTTVSSHSSSSSSHATTHCTILLLAPNAVKSFRFLGKE